MSKREWRAMPIADADGLWFVGNYLAKNEIDFDLVATGIDEPTARLIAAAPDMAEALKSIAVGEGVYGLQAHEYKQIARAVLKKVGVIK